MHGWLARCFRIERAERALSKISINVNSMNYLSNQKRVFYFYQHCDFIETFLSFVGISNICCFAPGWYKTITAHFASSIGSNKLASVRTAGDIIIIIWMREYFFARFLCALHFGQYHAKSCV